MNAYILVSLSCRFSIAHHDAFLLCVGTGALIALKKAHRYADEQKKMQATILNLENQKMSIESAAFNVEIMQTYETSSKTLKNIHKDMYVVFILTGMQDDLLFVVDSNCVFAFLSIVTLTRLTISWRKWRSNTIFQTRFQKLSHATLTTYLKT